MFFRTDLALELKEGGQSELLDVPCKIKEKDRCKISHITVPCHIKDTGMAPGEYITIEMPPLSDALDENNRFLQVVSDEIKPFLPENGEVLVAGLGNAAITPDALGEKVIAQILATRHVKKELERITGISELRSVAAVSTDVLGNTGMETAEILKGLTQQLRPKAVIVMMHGRQKFRKIGQNSANQYSRNCTGSRCWKPHDLQIDQALLGVP